MSWKDYVDLFSALLTPTIAIITTYIAIQQYRNRMAKFRYDLYDRRMAIFKAASNYLTAVTSHPLNDNAEEEEKAFKEFVAANAESQFLFDKDDWLFLGLIHITGSRRYISRLSMKSGDAATIKEQERTLAETMETHQQQAMRLREVFVKYFDLKKLK